MSKEALAVLDDKAVANLNDVLKGMIESGEVKVSELNPSLNALLTDPQNGGFAGRAFVGEVVGYRKAVPLPDMNDEDATVEVDILELKDLSGNFLGNTFNFYGRNGGLKAKISGVEGKKFVVVAFKGEVASENKNYNPYKDYLVLGAEKKENATNAYVAIEKAVGRKAVEPVAVGAGKK